MHSLKSSEQFFPVNPTAHVQLNPPYVLVHVPPFRQGVPDIHSLTSTEQLFPVNVAGHVQLYPPSTPRQLPPFWHRFPIRH